MGRNGEKQTETDRNIQKWTETDRKKDKMGQGVKRKMAFDKICI